MHGLHEEGRGLTQPPGWGPGDAWLAGWLPSWEGAMGTEKSQWGSLTPALHPISGNREVVLFAMSLQGKHKSFLHSSIRLVVSPGQRAGFLLPVLLPLDTHRLICVFCKHILMWLTLRMSNKGRKMIVILEEFLFLSDVPNGIPVLRDHVCLPRPNEGHALISGSSTHGLSLSSGSYHLAMWVRLYVRVSLRMRSPREEGAWLAFVTPALTQCLPTVGT